MTLRPTAYSPLPELDRVGDAMSLLQSLGDEPLATTHRASRSARQARLGGWVRHASARSGATTCPRSALSGSLVVRREMLFAE
jgi:hypothetical protein